MASYLRTSILATLLASSAILSSAQTGTGITTRYWDCCKTGCASNLDGVTAPVRTCDINDQPFVLDPIAAAAVTSGCDDTGNGMGFACSDQTPWAINDDLAYGFAAVNPPLGECCKCYKLTFTSGTVQGKQMIVQATNTGFIGDNQFDIAIPGGGFGFFDACTREWGATTDIWGERYGGATIDTCDSFPAPLQPGCRWRYDWFLNADNPNVNYEVVPCPDEIIARSGCALSNGP